MGSARTAPALSGRREGDESPPLQTASALLSITANHCQLTSYDSNLPANGTPPVSAGVSAQLSGFRGFLPAALEHPSPSS